MNNIDENVKKNGFDAAVTEVSKKAVNAVQIVPTTKPLMVEKSDVFSYSISSVMSAEKFEFNLISDENLTKLTKIMYEYANSKLNMTEGAADVLIKAGLRVGVDTDRFVSTEPTYPAWLFNGFKKIASAGFKMTNANLTALLWTIGVVGFSNQNNGISNFEIGGEATKTKEMVVALKSGFSKDIASESSPKRFWNAYLKLVGMPVFRSEKEQNFYRRYTRVLGDMTGMPKVLVRDGYLCKDLTDAEKTLQSTWAYAATVMQDLSNLTKRPTNFRDSYLNKSSQSGFPPDLDKLPEKAKTRVENALKKLG